MCHVSRFLGFDAQLDSQPGVSLTSSHTPGVSDKQASPERTGLAAKELEVLRPYLKWAGLEMTRVCTASP